MLTAENFYNAFKNRVTETSFVDIKNKVTCFELYNNWHEFTRYVTQVINNIITDFGYSVSNEYYNIDVIGWTQKKYDNENASLKAVAKAKNLSFYLWDLNIVVEHENNKSEWLDELVKLFYIKCPLKVIITYNYCDERNDGQYSDIDKVEFAKNILLKLNNNIPVDEEYLIIFGNATGKESNNEYNTFDYRGYAINGVKIKQL